jgi:hypothetical protein
MNNIKKYENIYMELYKYYKLEKIRSIIKNMIKIIRVVSIDIVFFVH